MEEEKNPVPEEPQSSEETKSPEEDKKAKTSWQTRKEGWYDKIPLTAKQLDIIVGVCLTLLGLTFLAICLDALGIFHLFG